MDFLEQNRGEGPFLSHQPEVQDIHMTPVILTLV
jgi:hypothetical protein